MTQYEALLNKRLNELYNTMGEEWVEQTKHELEIATIALQDDFMDWEALQLATAFYKVLWCAED